MINLADWIFGRSAAPPAHDDYWYYPGGSFYGGGPAVSSDAGISVTPELGLTVSVVHACTRILSLVGYLPLRTYRRDGRARQRLEDHPSEVVLRRPNDAMTSCEFRELMTTTMLLRGNAVAEITRTDTEGRPLEMWPIPPEAITYELVENDRRLIYHVRQRDGTMRKLERLDVFHLRDCTKVGTGLVATSRIGLARQAIGLTLATESHGSRYFGQGARPAFVIEIPNRLNDAQYDRLRDQFNELYGGPENTGSKTALLENGAKPHVLSFPHEDAQFLETRMFQVEELACLFGVPMHLLSRQSKQTSFGAGVEQMSIGLVVFTHGPIMTNWEQAIDRDVLVDEDRADRVYVKHNADALVRGDLKTRGEYYERAIQNEWLSPNEVRSLEDENPRDGGDEYRNPMRSDPADAGDRPAETDGGNGGGAIVHPSTINDTATTEESSDALRAVRER
jgi:HK97 family phage portal protein